MKIIALKSFRYDGKPRNPGDAFETKKASDAQILVAIRKARYADVRLPVAVAEPDPGTAGRIGDAMSSGRVPAVPAVPADQDPPQADTLDTDPGADTDADGGAATGDPDVPSNPVEDPVDQPAEISDIDALRAEAMRLGIDVDKRWGVPRLQKEIAKAKA